MRGWRGSAGDGRWRLGSEGEHLGDAVGDERGHRAVLVESREAEPLRRVLRDEDGQGNRISTGEHLEQRGVVPAAHQALGLDADLDGAFLAQQIEREMPQDREVLRCMAGSN